MTLDEYKDLLANPLVIKHNPHLVDVSNPHRAARQIAKLESASGDDALATPRLQKATRQSFRVRVCSARKRLLDEDNTVAKFCVDQCRYAGWLPDDNAALTKIEVTQRKCEADEPEHVEIIIERI